MGGRGKSGPKEINICEVYSRRGKAIGSKEFPMGIFLQQQQIRNRMDLKRKLIFPAGPFTRGLTSVCEQWSEKSKLVIMTEFTVPEKEGMERRCGRKGRPTKEE